MLTNLSTQTIILIDTQTGKPIENVNVFAGNNGTTTNSNGSCNLDIFNKNNIIGFITQEGKLFLVLNDVEIFA